MSALELTTVGVGIVEWAKDSKDRIQYNVLRMVANKKEEGRG